MKVPSSKESKTVLVESNEKAKMQTLQKKTRVKRKCGSSELMFSAQDLEKEKKTIAGNVAGSETLINLFLSHVPIFTFLNVTLDCFIFLLVAIASVAQRVKRPESRSLIEVQLS